MQPREQGRGRGRPAQQWTGFIRPVEIHGTFQAPSGRTGTMRGTFRGQRLVDRAGRLAVDGMFSGVLLDDDGSRIGTASRRQHVPTHQTGPPGGPQFDIGPVDVDLLGLTVMIAKTTISGDEKD